MQIDILNEQSLEKKVLIVINVNCSFSFLKRAKFAPAALMDSPQCRLRRMITCLPLGLSKSKLSIMNLIMLHAGVWNFVKNCKISEPLTYCFCYYAFERA